MQYLSRFLSKLISWFLKHRFETFWNFIRHKLSQGKKEKRLQSLIFRDNIWLSFCALLHDWQLCMICSIVSPDAFITFFRILLSFQETIFLIYKILRSWVEFWEMKSNDSFKKVLIIESYVWRQLLMANKPVSIWNSLSTILVNRTERR